MKATIEIELPEDFRLHCEIFSFRPEEVIQEFVNRISLPAYFRDPEDNQRWANLFFLRYLDNAAPERITHDDIDRRFVDKLQEQIRITRSKAKREKICREILLEWNQEIQKALKKRSKT